MSDIDLWGDDDYEHDPDYDPAADCLHEQADIDILSGRGHCFSCGHFWMLSADELKAELRWLAEYDEAAERDAT